MLSPKQHSVLITQHSKILFFNIKLKKSSSFIIENSQLNCTFAPIIIVLTEAGSVLVRYLKYGFGAFSSCSLFIEYRQTFNDGGQAEEGSRSMGVNYSCLFVVQVTWR